MKVKVLKEFRDINKFSTIFKEGTVIDISDERAKMLLSIGYVEKITVSDEDEKASTKVTK